MKIIYMGTPDFAVPALQSIIEAGHEVTLVVTQPDKPKGRGGKVQFPPVKEKALEHNIEVFQPVKIREPENVEVIAAHKPDLIVVAAFGQLLTPDILNIPKYGCINIHASLLPRWRGAAPIQSAVIEGDRQSGITIMQMDEGLDTGDILLQKAVDIAENETGGSLHDKLCDIGGGLVVECISLIENGETAPVPQSGDFTYARKLDKKMGLIDFEKSSNVIECLVRGLNPWPSAYTYYKGKLLKIWNAEALDTLDSSDIIDSKDNMRPGTIVNLTKDSIYVRTGEGFLKINEIQPEGKRRMAVADYLRGCKMGCGEVLGMAE